MIEREKGIKNKRRNEKERIISLRIANPQTLRIGRDPQKRATKRPLRDSQIRVIFSPIWLKFGMESLNGRTQQMYVIYMHLSMLTGQTDLPPNQPTGLKVKNLHNLVIFQLIWLKLGMGSLNGRTQHMRTIYPVKSAYHPPAMF